MCKNTAMKKLIAIFVLFFMVATSYSQTKKATKKAEKRERNEKYAKLEEEGVVVFKKHFLGGIKLINDGYGGFIEKGIFKTPKTALLFQIDISERKHTSESKEFSQFAPEAGRLIYGKINFFYPIKLGTQYQLLFGNKGNKNGVNLTGNFGGGISLGLLRPYLMGYQDGNKISYFGLGPTVQDSIRFLTERPVAAPGITTGFNKLKVTPGLYTKASLRFDYGKFNETVTAIEVGVTAEYYTKAIPQVIFQKERNLFVGAYFSILFGKRK
jgi:hypothetical protein